MADTQSLAKLQQLHPKLRDIATQAYNDAVAATPIGVHPTVDATYRSFAESDILYQQGRTTPGQIVSNAPAGHSWHNYGLAVDFHLIVNGQDVWPDDPPNDPDWMTVVNVFKGYGFNWGGDFAGSFKDYPHVENQMGQSISGLLQLHIDGKLIPGTPYVDF